MSWARIDDRFHSHPKVVAAGNAAVGVYARALAYCAGYATDGFVAKAVAESFGSRKELEQLCAVGLWAKVEAGEVQTVRERIDGLGQALGDVVVVMPAEGYFVADFLHFNPTKAETDELRERRRESGRLGGQRRAGKAVRDSGGRFVSQASVQAGAWTERQAGAWDASKQAPGERLVQRPGFPVPVPVKDLPTSRSVARENGNKAGGGEFSQIGEDVKTEVERLASVSASSDDDIAFGVPPKGVEHS